MPMKPADRVLQRWRVAKALRWVRPGSHVLDVGCADGALFHQGRERIPTGVGVDRLPSHAWLREDVERRTGDFPAVIGDDETYDAIALLAVVEHIPDDELSGWATACTRLLRRDGRVIATVPSPAVDTIVRAGIRLRLLHGLEAHQHHGFEPSRLPGLFDAAGLRLEHASRFQLGLNNLFVFSR